MAPLVVYLMSTLCARGGFDNLRTRVAPAAAAYGARLEHPIVAVVDECGDLGLLACERCAPSPLAPLVSSECTNCDGVDVIVASCPGGKFGPGPGCKTDAAVAHFARRFPATNPAWLAFSDDDMHYFVPWFAALLRFVEGAGHSAAVPLALGGRDRKFKTERIQASFHRFKDRAPCLLTGAPRIVLPLVLSSAAAEKLAPFCLNRVTEKQCGAFRTTHDTCLGVVLWRLEMRYLPVFEECRLVTNIHRIADTIGDAWPLVAVDRVHRGRRWEKERLTFSENEKHLTDHDAAIRHDGSLDRLSACVNATAASPLGDVHGIKRPIAPDAAPITLPDCGVCRDLPLRDLQRLQREQAAEARDRVCARSKRRPVISDPL